MIRLAGTAKRSFIFPGSIHEAMRHYSRMDELVKYLPNITLNKTYSKTQFRVLFRSTELSIYKIQLYCDLELTIDTEKSIITVGTLNGKTPVKQRAGMHTIRGMAKFSSTSQFKPEGRDTRIYYYLSLKGELPKPRGFSMVPDNMTDHIARNIAKHRIFEIADGFILESLASFERKENSSNL